MSAEDAEHPPHSIAAKTEPQRELLALQLVRLLEMPSRLAALEAETRALREEVKLLRRALPQALAPLPEAARLLGVSISTLRRRVRAGDIPVVRIGRSLRVDLAGLRAPDDADVARLAADSRRGAVGP